MRTLQLILIGLIFGMGQGTMVVRAAEIKLTASDAARDDWFGKSISISGDYAIVGANGNDDAGSNSGSAYIFVRSGETWNEQAKLTASDAAWEDRFGSSVSISGDYAIVGAYGHDHSWREEDVGSAYIFVRNGENWIQQAKLTASDAAGRAHFGISVSISGETAIVGADWNESAYIFVRNGETWTQQAKLTPSDGGGLFGRSVSISGETALVAADRNSHAGEKEAGAAYIFVRSGEDWIQQAKLTASGAAADDCFGVSVSLSGNYAIVGACGTYWDIGSESSAAYIFENPEGGWSDMTETAKLTASDAGKHDLFGFSVSISGETALVGARRNDHAGGTLAGAAYLFLQSGSSWSQKIKIAASDAAAYDLFGHSVSISGDYAIVGALGGDDGGTDSGSTYIYHCTDDLSIYRRPTAVSHQAEVTPLPDEYTLQQSYPNPFNPATTIQYQLPEPGEVTLTIYDLLGQEVRMLVSERQSGGWYRARWDGKDEAGKLISSGVYLYRLEVGKVFLRTRKMMVVR